MSVHFATMENIERRIIIKFVVKLSLGPMEIYSEMANVVGESAPPKTMVYKWAVEFKRCLIIIETNPRAERPKSAKVQWNPSATFSATFGAL